MGSGKWNTQIGYFCYFYLHIYPFFKECGKYSGSPLSLKLNLAFIANFERCNYFSINIFNRCLSSQVYVLFSAWLKKEKKKKKTTAVWEACFH